jgi:hypothetical protein
MRRAPLHVARISGTDPSQVCVIASNPIAYGFFEVAMELWRLAGRADRASSIRKVINSAYTVEPPRLERAQIEALRGLIDGLEQALVGTVTDDEHMLSVAKVAELRGQTLILDLDESRGDLAREAVQEALVYVDHLRTIADEALAANASILFD